jgi:hypothetical protein
VTWSDLLAGLPIGVLVGITVKAVLDAFSERRRRRHDQEMRHLDAGIEHGVAFLSAADRLRRTAQDRSRAWYAWDTAKHGAAAFGASESLPQAEARFVAADQAFADDMTAAQNAYNAVRLLIPSASDAAGEYLDLCATAGKFKHENEVKRDAARKRVEEIIRSKVGGGLS